MRGLGPVRSVVVLLSVVVVVSLTGAPGAAVGVPSVGAVVAADVPVDVPGVPFLAEASADGLSASGAWVPNAAGDQVTEYRLSASPVEGSVSAACPSPVARSVTAKGSDSQARVEGLCAQVGYVLTLSASNVVGSSEESPPSVVVVPLPMHVPRAPLITDVLARPGTLEVSWSPPAFDGGGALSGFTLTASRFGTAVSQVFPASASSGSLSGLANGVEYEVSLTAANAVGVSDASTSTGTPRLTYAPGAPGQLSAVPDGAGGVTVSWDPPVDDGGAAIDGYVVEYWPMVLTGGAWVPDGELAQLTVGPDVLEVVVDTFQDPAGFYQFSVAGSNAMGVGQAAATESPATPRTEVKDTTVVLSDETVAGLSQVSASGLEWASPVPAQAAGLQVGDVIVAGVSTTLPGGVLREVTAVTDAGGGLSVSTAEASLDDVFTTMALSTTMDPTATTVPAGAEPAGNLEPQFLAMAPGVTTAGETGVSVEVGKTFAIDHNVGSVKMEALLALRAEISVGMSVSWGHATVDARALASADLEGKVGLKGRKELQIAVIEGIPSTFYVGLVPVVVQPRLPVFLTAQGEVTLGVSAHWQFGGALEWDSDDPGTLTPRNLTKAPSGEGRIIPGVTATGSLSVGLKLQPIASIYALGGPSLSITASVNADVNFNPGPGEAFFEVGPTVLVRAGLAIHRFGFHAEVEVKVFQMSWVWLTLWEVPTASYTVIAAADRVAAESSLQFTAVRSDGQEKELTWQVLGGVAGDAISTTGLFTPARPGGRTVTIAVGDDTGAGGRTEVTVGIPFSSPSPVSASQRSGELAADIRWSEPADTGGTALGSYMVFLEPSGARYAVPAGTTNLALDKIAPGFYVVTVYAQNTAGQVSAGASTTLFVTALCSNTWNGADGSSWTNATNWSLGHVPGSAETVCLNRGEPTIPAGASVTVAGLDADAATLTTEGTLTVTTYFRSVGTQFTGTGNVVGGQDVVWVMSGVTLTDGARVTNQGSLNVTSERTGTCGRTLCLGADAVLDNQADMKLQAGVTINDLEISPA